MNAPVRLVQRTERALAALAVDPHGLKGISFRARMGPARQAFETALRHLPGLQRRIHPGIADEQLFGGLNIAASLAEGRPVRDAGLAAQPGTLILTMAERCTPQLSARLAQLLDRDQGHSLILLDEAASPEEGAPDALLERLAFHIEAEEGAKPVRLPAAADIDAARILLPNVGLPSDAVQVLVAIAARFGIESLRAPLFALRTARALAAVDRQKTVTEAHLQEAAELIFVSRATIFPQDEATDTPEQDDPSQQDIEGGPEGESQRIGDIPDEILVQAIRTLLPADLLERVKARKSRSAQSAGSGAGDRRKGNRRGRPLPSRPGKPGAQNRIDAVATLRAAAPWQKLRRKTRGDARRVIIYPDDIRVKRYEDRSDRLLIFAVDASGSAAVARMAEAKGSVELMLAQAYARRDQVALLAFRNRGAEILLQPTRSLVQAKRQLAGLPGGGGTPLASGLLAAAELGALARSRGMAPMLILLTDGRANISLDGEPDRIAALEDAARAAKALAARSIDTVLIDTSNRPADQAKVIARHLQATYMALPRADAHGISRAVETALDS
ncbi:MAG: magnesium chelatase subunit D [Pseudomonadota bacterium]